MKHTILTIALLTAFIGVKAQTYSGQFKSQVTDHFKNDVKTASTAKFTPGTIEVLDKEIKVNTEQFIVLKTTSTDKADEGYTTKSMIVVSQTKNGTYKAIDCVLLINPKGRIAEVIFKKTKSTNVSYIID